MASTSLSRSMYSPALASAMALADRHSLSALCAARSCSAEKSANADASRGTLVDAATCAAPVPAHAAPIAAAGSPYSSRAGLASASCLGAGRHVPSLNGPREK